MIRPQLCPRHGKGSHNPEVVLWNKLERRVDSPLELDLVEFTA